MQAQKQFSSQHFSRMALGLIATSWLALSGCSGPSVLAAGALHDASFVTTCPARETKVCHVAWGSKIRGNQRDYSCSCAAD